MGLPPDIIVVCEREDLSWLSYCVLALGRKRRGQHSAENRSRDCASQPLPDAESSSRGN